MTYEKSKKDAQESHESQDKIEFNPLTLLHLVHPDYSL